MAYVQQFDENTQENMQGGNAAGQQQLGGQGAAISGSAQPQTAQSGSKKSFSNISQYLQQNQPQSAKLGEKVGGFVGQKVQDAGNALQQGQAQFGEQVGQNTRQFNQEAVNAFGQAPDVKAPQFGQLQQQLSGSYAGPKDLDQNVFNKTQEAKKTADLTQSESGRKQLLQNVQNPKRASAGVTSLNNLLLQNNPEAQAKIQSQKANADKLQQDVTAAQTQAQSQAAAAEAQNKQVADQTRQAFLGEEGFLNKFKSGLEQKTQAAKTEAEKRSQAAQALLKGGDVQMTPEARAQALKDIGISEEEYGKISRAYNPNSGKDFGFGTKDAKQQFALADQYARATGDKSVIGGDIASRNLNNTPETIAKLNNYYNQQNKYGQYADQMGIGTQDLSNYATFGGLNQDPNALRQQVASKDDLAKLNAFNSLLGTQENFIYDSPDLGSFNSDLVNFDRIRAGLV